MRSRHLALLTAALLSGSALPAAGQNVNIRGRIVAADTREPLVGAYISSRFPSWSAFTDSAGNFMLRDVPRDALRLTAGQLGYIDMTITISPSDTAGIELALPPNPVALTALNVSVDRMDRRRRTVPTAVRFMDRATMLSSAGNPLDIIRTQSAMFITPCPYGSNFRHCTFFRGRTVSPVVFIDERRALGGLDELETYPSSELYAIETYGGSMVRAYTIGFMDSMTRRGRVLDAVLYW